MFCLNALNGSIRWKFQTGGMIKCQACVTESRVIFGSYDKFVYTVDIESGCLLYKIEMSARSDAFLLKFMCSTIFLSRFWWSGGLSVT